MKPPPPGVSDRIWVVIRPGGERYYIDKEPLEGMAKWSEGLRDVTILEYQFKIIMARPR